MINQATINKIAATHARDIFDRVDNPAEALTCIDQTAACVFAVMLDMKAFEKDDIDPAIDTLAARIRERVWVYVKDHMENVQ